MASWLGFLLLFGILIINNLLLGTFGMDSEIVEAQTGGIVATDLNETGKISLEKMRSSNGTLQVQPYNILEASCPHGYVLTNKHCHKSV
ncbi:uncharacterized protein LOC122320046 [Drosophila ficusphila]|uniref:uncharacterized protein LOC122320046 n=1 Tax=Drosophila ficusphila TaxID=30025 RepID=UPI001C88F869|nr:uncharacterized protein LOC122320046 [Drosophila ficusphila]